ncbi:MAG: hypothetical protein MR601_04585 [Erysipelotrichaceae bacterium]|nr:hypothetical protein [Erysipelotrichaceae bacterium]
MDDRYEVIKKYLGEKYTDNNNLFNLLMYYKVKKKSNRIEHDLDCMLVKDELKENEDILKADMMFSMFSIINQYCKLHNLHLLKDELSLKEVEELKKEENHKLLFDLSDFAITRANVMILPSRKLQRRGLFWQDQMPKTLEEIIEDNGCFNNYFEDKTKIEKWITEQKLSMFFENGNLHSIKCPDFLKSDSGIIGKKIMHMNEKELKEYMEYALKILKERSKFFMSE